MIYSLLKVFAKPLPLFVLLGATACSQEGNHSANKKSDTVEIDTINAFGEREVFYYHPTDGKKEGSYKRWSKSGKPIEEAHFSNGQLDKMRILYFENGDTQIVENYRGGLFHGKYKTFYPNGKIQLVGQYQDNKMEGLWIKYYEDGTLMEKVHFSNNLENGAFQEYYPNGIIKTEGKYRNGDNEHGRLKMFDETGRHVKSMECQDGICKTIWRIDG